MEFCEGKQDYKSWCRGLLVVVIYKAGKPKDNPNKYQGVKLINVVLKVLSKTLYKILFKLLDINGTKYQLGGSPKLSFRDGIFALKHCCIQ